MIEVTDREGVAVVRLRHGPVNALDLELLRRITDTFRDLDAGSHRAVVLTGAGRAFSAGVDLWRIADGGAEYVEEFLSALTTAFETVFTVGKPVVAAVNGHAIAGGCIFACCCDHRVMADGPGRIGVTELAVGVPFPVTALRILEYTMGARATRSAVFGAATYPAREAVARGMVDEVVGAGDLEARAVAVASELAASAPADTYRLTKEQLQLAIVERLRRERAVQDPKTRELWVRAAADGRIRDYMERVTRRS